MEFDNLLTLIKTVSQSALTDLKYEEKGVKIHLTKQPGRGTTVDAAAETDAVLEVSGEQDDSRIIRSPLVGTFYAAPAEDAEPFVRVGDAVKKGQTVAIVEAMKLMNEIESDCDGTVAQVYPENGQAVEYGQPLFRVV